MKEILNEKHENIKPATPILDAILAELPPPSYGLKPTQDFNIIKNVLNKLVRKAGQDKLTQMDIENALSQLPHQGGIEDAKVQLVDKIRMNLLEKYSFNIKNLPIEKQKSV